MSSQWIETDWDGIGRLAILWDEFYKAPSSDGLKEIRLQNPAFGLTPIDRARLQWEIVRGDEAEKKRTPERPARRTGTSDPRNILMAVK